MRLTGLALLLALGVVDEPGKEFYQDFRNKDFPEAAFSMTGPDAANRVRPEPEGLRITLPAEQQEVSAVGVLTQFPIKGNFEITVAYEIIQTDRPKAGFGVGLEIYLRTDTPTGEAAAFYRIIRPSGAEVYAVSRMTTNKQGKRVGVLPGFVDVPAVGKSGQLRITRNGALAVLSAADEAGKDFQVLFRFNLGSEDINMLRLGANPGNAANPVDLRVRDLRVRTLEQNLDIPRIETRTPPRGSALLWLVALVAAGLVIGGFLIWWRKRRAETEEEKPREAGARNS